MKTVKFFVKMGKGIWICKLEGENVGLYGGI